MQHLLAAVGAGEELEPALEHSRRDDRLARIGATTEGGVELGKQRLAEAARQPGARQAEQIADLAQPHPLQRLPVLAPRTEQPDGTPSRAPAGSPRASAQSGGRIDAGEDGGALRRRCAGDGERVAERLDARAQALQQAIDAAEVAQARLHLEQHGVGGSARLARRLERDVRREGERGVRDRQHGLGIARRIGLAEDDARRQRERGGALQPRLDALRQRRRVGGRDAMLVDQRDRRTCRSVHAFAVRGERRRERFEREQRQMQRDPEHDDDGKSRAGSERVRAKRGQLKRNRRRWLACRARRRSPALAERRRAAPESTLGSSSCSGASSGGPRRLRIRTCKRSAPPACNDRRSGDAVGRAAAAALAHHEGGAVVVVGRQLETAQPLGAQARRQPGDDRADVTALQRLLERPQAVAARDDRAPGRPAGRVPTGGSERSERRGTHDARASGRRAAPRRQSRARRAPPPTRPRAGRTPSPAVLRVASRPARARAGGSRRPPDAAAAARSAPAAASRRRAARRPDRRNRWRRFQRRCGRAGGRARVPDAGFPERAGRRSRWEMADPRPSCCAPTTGSLQAPANAKQGQSGRERHPWKDCMFIQYIASPTV